MKELESIRRLAGQIDKEQLRYVDCFLGADIGLFMPVGGACFYALTPLHSHPSYMFILPFNDQTSLQMDGKTITAIPGRICALSIEICHGIIRSIFDFALINDRISSRIEIDRVIEHLHSNLDKKITVEEMAKTVHMSSSHFSRIFKKEIGKSPIDCLNQIRLERVKKRLLSGDKSITEIALECGFNSSAYLSACFYKKYKLSPTDYPRSMKKGLIPETHDKISKN